MKKVLLAITAATMLGAVGSATAADGEAIYKRVCFACHDTGAAGAPKMGDKAAWGPRIAKGTDALVTSVTNGLNAMPPKGTCADCSADDLKAAVEYIVGHSK